MRFLAIHFDGYGGSGQARVSFEIEAEGPDFAPTGIFPHAGASPVDFELGVGQLRVTPDVDAVGVAMLSGGQHVGLLARESDGMVIAGPNGLVPEDEQFHWLELNAADPLTTQAGYRTRTEPGLISISQIVERYGVARKTVMRWLEAGKILPAFTLPGRTGAHLFTIEAADAAFADWNGAGSQLAEGVGDAVRQVLTTGLAPESPAASEREVPRLMLPHWSHTSYGLDQPLGGRSSHWDWSSVLAALEEWLSSDVAEALAQPVGVTWPDRVRHDVPLWDSADLHATEARLRDVAALRDTGRISSDYYYQWDGIWTVDALVARAVFEQGRNEDSLLALNGPLEMGCPYWLLQIRFIAEGRLAEMIGAPSLAFESFWRSLDVPLNGLADVDYLLRSLYELATLESSWLSGVPEQAEWARLALSFGEKLQDHRGVWFDATIKDELRVIMHGTAT